MKRYVFLGVILLQLFVVRAQRSNWQNLDLKNDSVFGISTEKTYKTLLTNKKPKQVIVAVVDSGIDTVQEDLRSVLWTNPSDGSHGYNFLGYEKGKEDVTNLASFKKDFYDSLAYTMVPETYRASYQAHRKGVKEYQRHLEAMQELVLKLKAVQMLLDNIVSKIGKINPDFGDFQSYSTENKDELDLIKLVTKKLPHYENFAELKKRELDDITQFAEYHKDHGLSVQDANDRLEHIKSNNPFDIQSEPLGLLSDPNFTSYHGTHVSGIIAADRNNSIGMMGVADQVKVMTLKVLNNIRELRDDNLAKAFRYAADHGAKVINLSFGKPYTWDKKAVDDAVQYAMSKDVLIVHAAGNAGDNLDVQDHYPNPNFLDGKNSAGIWLEVGASGWKDDSTLIPSFSNYGKKSVDVFAPGVDIYSTLPFNQYAAWNGTSMAAPVVAGLAALIREYFPKLTAAQVKEIIMKSVVKVEHEVLIHGQKLPFSEICVSGGIVNAYNAIILAAKYK